MKFAFTTLTATLILSATAGAQTPAGGQRQGAANQPGQQSQTAEESFKKRDANKDNFLSKTEITGSRVADNFDKLDTNKDGKLSLAEYKAGRDAMQGQQGPQGMGAQTQGQPGQGGGQMQSADAMFKTLDANSDGFVSKAEVAKSRMADRFDQFDSNKDGKLSLNELKAGRETMQQQRGNGAPNGVAPAKKTST